MSKLYLHVGMPKTGTSFIQGFVNVNITNLEKTFDYRYITDRRAHEIACHLIDDSHLKTRKDIKELRQSDKENLDGFFKEIFSEGKNCFCSSEYFSLCDRQRVIEYFTPYFDEIHIILTVRRQDRLIASGYNQDVKALARTSNLAWAYEHSLGYRYVEICEGWESFGCAVHVIDYDSARQSDEGIQGEVLSLFLDKVLLRANDFKKPTADSNNFSLSRGQLYLALTMNRMGLPSLPIIAEFNYADEEFLLPAYFTRMMAAVYRKENENLKKRFPKENLFSNFDYSDVKNIESFDSGNAKFNWDPVSGFESVIKFLIQSDKL